MAYKSSPTPLQKKRKKKNIIDQRSKWKDNQRSSLPKASASGNFISKILRSRPLLVKL